MSRKSARDATAKQMRVILVLASLTAVRSQEGRTLQEALKGRTRDRLSGFSETREESLNTNPNKVIVVIGTRPEAIKLAPVVLELERHRTHFETKICVTGQHREMLDQMLQV